MVHPASDTHGTDAVHKPSISVITSRIRFDRTTLVMGLKIGSLVSFLLILYAQDLVALFLEARAFFVGMRDAIMIDRGTEASIRASEDDAFGTFQNAL